MSFESVELTSWRFIWFRQPNCFKDPECRWIATNFFTFDVFLFYEEYHEDYNLSLGMVWRVFLMIQNWQFSDFQMHSHMTQPLTAKLVHHLKWDNYLLSKFVMSLETATENTLRAKKTLWSWNQSHLIEKICEILWVLWVWSSQ